MINSYSYSLSYQSFPFDCRMNISSPKNEEQEWKSSTSDYEIILWCTLFILTAIAILCANIFAIFIFTTRRLLRKRNNILLMNLATADLKIGPQCGHVWLTSYPGPRGFSCLFAALVLSSYAEKNQENPL